MVYFRLLYQHIAGQALLVLEAKERGLELKLDEFFYDPKTGAYNSEFRERLLQGEEEFREELKRRRPLKVGRYRYIAEAILADILFTLSHPIETYKLNMHL